MIKGRNGEKGQITKSTSVEQSEAHSGINNKRQCVNLLAQCCQSVTYVLFSRTPFSGIVNLRWIVQICRYSYVLAFKFRGSSLRFPHTYRLLMLSSAISKCNTLNGALRQGLPVPPSRRLSPPVDGIQNRKGAGKDSTPEGTGCVAPHLSCERPRPTGELMLRRSTCL